MELPILISYNQVLGGLICILHKAINRILSLAFIYHFSNRNNLQCAWYCSLKSCKKWGMQMMANTMSLDLRLKFKAGACNEILSNFK